eukprot:scaffold76995_cov26-Prasinocladus_malaysianus.AAC.2
MKFRSRLAVIDRMICMAVARGRLVRRCLGRASRKALSGELMMSPSSVTRLSGQWTTCEGLACSEPHRTDHYIHARPQHNPLFVADGNAVEAVVLTFSPADDALVHTILATTTI